MHVTRFFVFGVLFLAAFFAQSSCRSKPPVIKSQFYTLICDKQTGRFKLIDIILNDIDHIPLSRIFIDINDKRIAEVVYPLDLLSDRDHFIVNRAKAEKLYELCQGLSAQSNPVIRYLYFRK